MFKRLSIIPVIAVIVMILGISMHVEAKKGANLAGVVNINEASAEQLSMLPGVGDSKAQTIVAFRENARFETTEDIMKVKGIGKKVFETLNPYITVDGPTTAKLETNLNIE